jgi:chromosome segregation ATPase
LEDVEQLILNPDRVNTRLQPHLKQLENLFSESFLNELMRLDSLQGQIQQLQSELMKSEALKALSDFATELTEARDALEEARQAIHAAPRRIRPAPEDRDRAEKELRREAKLKDLENKDLTFQRLKDEADKRLAAQSDLASAGQAALERFAGFLLSPGVVQQLRVIQKPSRELTEVLASTDVRSGG